MTDSPITAPPTEKEVASPPLLGHKGVFNDTLKTIFEDIRKNPQNLTAKEISLLPTVQAATVVYSPASGIEAMLQATAESPFAVSLCPAGGKHQLLDIPTKPIVDNLPYFIFFGTAHAAKHCEKSAFQLMMAHEIKHTERLTDMWVNAKLNGAYFYTIANQMCQSFENRKRMISNTKNALIECKYDETQSFPSKMVKCAFLKLAHATLKTCYAASWPIHVIAAATYREEEFVCDNFAIRAFPDGNIEKFKSILDDVSWTKEPVKQKDIGLERFIQNTSLYLSDLLNAKTHPHPIRRYHHMKKIQDKMPK